MQKINEKQFVEIVELIQKARINALKSVNQELITLYWNIGKYIRKKIESAEWGELIIDNLADYIALIVSGFNSPQLAVKYKPSSEKEYCACELFHSF